MLGVLRAIIGYPFHLLKGIINALAVLVLAISSLILIAGLFGQGIGPTHAWSGVLDLMSHLRLQCLLGQLVSFLLFLLLQDKSWMIAAGLMLAFNLSDIVPYYIPQPKPFSAEAGSLKVVQWNVFKDNRHPDAFYAYIKQNNPDLIALEEVDQLWVAQLNLPLRQYPYRILLPQDNAFGIALYSKLPLSNWQVHYFGTSEKPVTTDTFKGFDLQKMAQDAWNKFFPPEQFPSIVASLRYRNQPMTVIVTHPMTPFGSGFDMRNQQMADLAIFTGRLKQPVILLGDFNCSSWSAYFKAFLKNSGLKDSQQGMGIQPSWPNLLAGPERTGFHKKIPAFVVPFFQTPIDHILISPQFVVLKRQLGPSETNSDHLPVLAELALNTH